MGCTSRFFPPFWISCALAMKNLAKAGAHGKQTHLVNKKKAFQSVFVTENLNFKWQSVADPGFSRGGGVNPPGGA